MTVSAWDDEWSDEDDEEVVFMPRKETVRSLTDHNPRGIELVELYRHKGGVKYWALHGELWVVGGPGCRAQDAVSLNITPEASRGVAVKIDRFQVRKGYRRKGFGTLVMRELVRLYRGCGALRFLIPVVSTLAGGRFYRKCGSIRGIELHEMELA